MFILSKGLFGTSETKKVVKCSNQSMGSGTTDKSSGSCQFWSFTVQSIHKNNNNALISQT